MSLILDALRKMEQERKARQGTAQELRPEVLRYRSRVEPKQGRLPVMVSLFLVAVSVGAASFYIGKRDAAKYQLQHPAFSGGEVPAAPSVPPVPASPVDAAPAPSQEQYAVSPPVAEPEPAPPAARSMTAASGVAPSGMGAAQPVGDSFISVTSTSRRHQAASAPTANRSTATALQAEQAAAAKQAVAPVPVQEARARRREATEVEQAAPADITISGIAFQDERHLRRAVINGTLVGEGEEVAGARVVEIKEHKVRMSRGGKLFEVPFGSGER